MTWNTSLIDGPIQVPVYSEPDEDGAREVLSYIPGYHLNVAPQVYTEELSVYVVTPNNPTRVFAGEQPNTVFLKFKDEAEAKSALNAYWIEE